MTHSIPNGGKIALVGIGPGAIEQMTVRAQEAIKESEVIVGYKTYIDLIKRLLDGKEVVQSGMLKEVDRANTAVNLALRGKKVAVISSGDAGIYGMAGLVFEVLHARGLSASDRVEVTPGVSALNAAAALLGAPLMHDFATISLSDALTPWPIIRDRLAMSAQSDFVIVLYNPRSRRRISQLQEARELIMQYRPASTPVGVVTSAYRLSQRIVLTDLEHLLDVEVGMFSTIIVGNSSTVVIDGRMVTPRGYGAKYDMARDDATADG